MQESTSNILTPKVSVIIVNYNGSNIITDCLNSLIKQSFKFFEIIIIDNDSSDDSLDKIDSFIRSDKSAFTIKFIKLDSNLGFTGGNLEGLKHARADYIALLNNDTEVDENWLEELFKAVEAHPDVGVCASKLLVYGTDNIDSAGDGFATSFKGFKIGEGESSEKVNNQEYVWGACAGAALYSNKMINEIGFLDDDFFLIHEDTDINFRVQLSGWKVLFVPTAIVFHKVRSSIGEMSDIAVYYTLRNSDFLRIKNIPLGILFRHLPEFILGTITEFIYFAIKHGKFNIYVKAKRDVIISLPKMLKKRRIIIKNKKVSNKYLNDLMTPIWNVNFLKSKLNKLFKD